MPESRHAQLKVGCGERGLQSRNEFAARAFDSRAQSLLADRRMARSCSAAAEGDASRERISGSASKMATITRASDNCFVVPKAEMKPSRQEEGGRPVMVHAEPAE
jgi:hypothetical protein